VRQLLQALDAHRLEDLGKNGSRRVGGMLVMNGKGSCYRTMSRYAAHSHHPEGGVATLGLASKYEEHEYSTVVP